MGPGPSDGQRTPHTGPVLCVLQAAGQAPVLCIPTAGNVVISLPGACGTEREVTGAGPLARSRWCLQQGSPRARHGSWQDACYLKLLCVCRPHRVGEVGAARCGGPLRPP